MGVLPSTQPVATVGSSLILSSFDLGNTCWLVLLRGGWVDGVADSNAYD